MDTLSKLFSSKTLVKALRLFLFHSDSAFDADDIASLTKSKKKDVTSTKNALLVPTTTLARSPPRQDLDV